MINPYFIEGPALISFSFGRTSGFMLKQIIDAHGGTLPPDVHVCFSNTGREREESLRFGHECETRWNVRVHWLEWRDRPTGKEGRDTPVGDRFEEVGYNSASRNGEPLAALYRRKNYLPNAVTRFCTAEAKIAVMTWFMLSLGYERWTNVVGLRADELRRITKQQKRNDEGKERFITTWPMLHAGTTKRDVWRFWLGGNADPKRLTEALPQGFDLGLYPYEGNCIDCFLKGRDVLIHTEREIPGALDWSIEQEATIGAQFVTEYPYAELQNEVARQPLLIPLDWRSLEFDAECGVSGTDASIRCGAARRAA